MRLGDALRGSALVALLVVIAFTFFLLHAALTTLRGAPETLTGNVVMIQNPGANVPRSPEVMPGSSIVIQPPPGGQGTVGADGKREEDFFLTENMQCWKRHGLGADDAIVMGDLLEKTRCARGDAGKKKIEAKVVNNCLTIAIERELFALLCIDQQQPEFAIDIPTGFGVAPALVVAKNYNSAILFLIFLLSALLLWGRIEISSFRERLHKGSHFGEGDVVEVRYIRPAPFYGEPQQQLSLAEIEKTHKKLLAERSEREAKILEKLRLKAEGVDQYIKEFNALAKEANEQLQLNNVGEAKRLYMALFPIYTRLYNSVDEASKTELQVVVKYLHDQVHIAFKGLKIRELIEEAYKETEGHRVDKDVREAAERSRDDSLQQRFDALRDLLEKNKYEEAKKVFGGTYREGTKSNILHGIHELDKTLPDIRRASRVKKELRALEKMVKGQG